MPAGLAEILPLVAPAGLDQFIHAAGLARIAGSVGGRRGTQPRFAMPVVVDEGDVAAITASGAVVVSVAAVTVAVTTVDGEQSQAFVLVKVIAVEVEVFTVAMMPN